MVTFFALYTFGYVDNEYLTSGVPNATFNARFLQMQSQINRSILKHTLLRSCVLL